MRFDFVHAEDYFTQEVIAKVVRIQSQRLTAVPAVLSNKKRKIKDKSKKDKSLSTNYTNEYFAVNFILRHRIKLTARASVLLVPFVDKKDFGGQSCTVKSW